MPMLRFEKLYVGSYIFVLLCLGWKQNINILGCPYGISFQAKHWKPHK